MEVENVIIISKTKINVYNEKLELPQGPVITLPWNTGRLLLSSSLSGLRFVLYFSQISPRIRDFSRVLDLLLEIII